MGLFDKLLGRSEPSDREIVPDRQLRLNQLMQLEGAILDVIDEMQQHPNFRNPGWKAQVQEFHQVLATERELRTRDFEWSDLVDLAFEVRPVVRTGSNAAADTSGLEKLLQLQERMMSIADALQTARPDEIRG